MSFATLLTLSLFLTSLNSCFVPNFLRSDLQLEGCKYLTEPDKNYWLPTSKYYLYPVFAIVNSEAKEIRIKESPCSGRGCVYCIAEIVTSDNRSSKCESDFTELAAISTPSMFINISKVEPQQGQGTFKLVGAPNASRHALFVERELDYESDIKNYTVVLRHVIDGWKYWEETVTIIVEDINDNRVENVRLNPEPDESGFIFFLDDLDSVGKVFTTIEADDADEIDKGKLSFHLVDIFSSNYMSYGIFSINEHTGELSIHRTSYSHTVFKLSDDGSLTFLLSVEVSDSNEVHNVYKGVPVKVIGTSKCLDEGKSKQPNHPKENSTQCNTKWIHNLFVMKDNITEAKDVDDLFQMLEQRILIAGKPNYVGNEIKNISELISDLVQTYGSFVHSSEEIKPILQRAIRIAETLVVAKVPWQHLSQIARSKTATSIIRTIEETSFQLALIINLENQNTTSVYEELLSSPKFTVGVYVTDKNSSESFDEFPPSSVIGSAFKLPANWKDLSPVQMIQTTWISMDAEYASLIMPGQYDKLTIPTNVEGNVKIMNGNLMTFTVGYVDENGTFNKIDLDFKDQGLQIIFKHEVESWGEKAYDVPSGDCGKEQTTAVLGSGQCVYWDENNSTWSNSGCKVISRSATETFCECNHLTSFSILFDVHNCIEKDVGLEILTWLLSSLSIICLTLTLVILIFIRSAKSDRARISKNLAGCLLLGNVLVLAVLDKTYLNLSEVFCSTAGMLIHYTFLAAFCWMALQGVNLYKLVIKIFVTAPSPFNLYRAMAYGLPLLVVGITGLSGYIAGDQPYGNRLVCWLNGTYIWGFMLPVFIVILGNSGILGVSLWKSYKIRNRKLSMSSKNRQQLSSIQLWIRGSFALTVLLGVTWLTGYFMLAPEIPGVVAAYCFVLLNASQGIFIFTFDCLLNENIRVGIVRQWGNYLPTRINNWLKETAVNSPETSYTMQSNKRKSATTSTTSTQNMEQITLPIIISISH